MIDHSVVQAHIEKLAAEAETLGEALEYVEREGWDVHDFKRDTSMICLASEGDLGISARDPRAPAVLNLVVSTLILGFSIGKAEGESLAAMPDLDNITEQD